MFPLESSEWGRRWSTVTHTATGVLPKTAGERLRAADQFDVEGRSLVVLQRED